MELMKKKWIQEKFIKMKETIELEDLVALCVEHSSMEDIESWANSVLEANVEYDEDGFFTVEWFDK